MFIIYCIYSKTANTTNIVNLLGVEIEKDQKFDALIAKSCFKAAVQLNAIITLTCYLGKSEKAALMNSFIYAKFNYGLLVCCFYSCYSARKIENFQNRCVRTLFREQP